MLQKTKANMLTTKTVRIKLILKKYCYWSMKRSTLLEQQYLCLSLLMIHPLFATRLILLKNRDFDTLDRELLDILEELGNTKNVKEHDVNATSLSCLKGHFRSDTIFNFSHRALSEIRVLGKGLDFAPIHRKMN